MNGSSKYVLNIFVFAFLLLTYSLSGKTDHLHLRSSIDLTTLSDKEKVDTFIHIAAELHNVEQYQEAFYALSDAAAIAEESSGYRLLEIYKDAGKCFYRLNDYRRAITYLKKALVISEQKEERQHLKIKGQLSKCYASLGDYNEAHKYMMESISDKEEHGNYRGLSSDYYDLGSLFFYQKAYEKALEYYRKSYELSIEYKLPRMIYNCIAAIGSTHASLGDIEKSLEYNLRSLEIADSLEYETGKAYSLNNIASNYYDIGKYDEAQDHLENSLLIKRILNDKWGQVGSLLLMSKILRKAKKFEEAEENLHRALELSEEINSKVRIAEVYQFYANLYTDWGKPNRTVDYLNQLLVFKDSLMNDRIINEMSERKSAYEIQKREHKISLLKKDNELLQAEQDVERLRFMIITAFAGLLLLSTLFWYYLFRRKKKSTILLEALNKEITAQKDKIEQQNEALENSNYDLKQFAYVVSHDLREPLRMVKSYGTILARRYKEVLDGSGQEFLFFMTDAAERMDKMLIDILNYSRTTSGEKVVDELNILTIIDTAKDSVLRGDKYPTARIEVLSDKFPVLLGNETQIYQLVQNLMTNGLKYNQSEIPTVKINWEEDADNHIFSFTDNGIGIAEGDQKRIFDMFQRLHGRGEYEGTGIGLATCKKIVERHNGKLWVNSKAGVGSTFYFSVPKTSDKTVQKTQMPAYVN